MRDTKGVTLISLIITIIILLILAGVSIAILTGNNGILKNANKSKEATEISEEKEKVTVSQNADLVANHGKNNTKQGLQQELDNIEGINKTKVIKDGKDSYIVTFLETNRSYRIKNGKEIEGPIDIEIVTDNQAGDITKGNTLDGTKENPYKINCIEDLVDFSNKSQTNNFLGKEIIMTRNLDFQSELSYEDYQTTKYGDINNDGKISELMEELTTGTGFETINMFQGTFDGKNNKLNNLYINSDKDVIGFFREIKNATINNLIINGEIYCRRTGVAGGIVAYASEKVLLYNLEYNGKIEVTEDISMNAIGGILGYGKKDSQIEINQCRNKTNINEQADIGGICGKTEIKIRIVNCYNEGNLTAKVKNEDSNIHYFSIGGIIGSGKVSYINIENCYNKGNIVNELNGTYSGAGGIIGATGNSTVNISNCYNIGKTSSKYSYIAPFAGGIQGGFWYGTYKSIISNCYYDGNKSDRSVGGAKEEYATKLTTEQMQGRENIENQDGTSSTLVELLNKEIDNNTNNIDTTGWLKWKQGEDGYPDIDMSSN